MRTALAGGLWAPELEMLRQALLPALHIGQQLVQLLVLDKRKA